MATVDCNLRVFTLGYKEELDWKTRNLAVILAKFRI